MRKRVRVNLAYLRAIRGRVSQKSIAEATGIAQKTLSALESGRTKGIDFSTLVKLCDYLNCSPNELLLIEDEPEDKPLPEDVLVAADQLIARALHRAMEAPPQTPEEVWARFDALRMRMAASAQSAAAQPPNVKRRA